MSYYNTNLAYADEDVAYDLSRFDTSLNEKRREQAKLDRASKINLAPAVSVSKSGSIIKIVLSVALMFGAFSAVNYFDTKKYNVSREVAAQEELLQHAQDDNALLQSKLDAKANIAYIEQYATENLGMSKVTSSQKKYISINTENLIEVDSDDTQSVVGSVKKWFNQILEYIGF